MAPKKSSKATIAPANGQSDSQDASQDPGMARAFEKRIQEKTSERRENKAASVRGAHNDRISQLGTDVGNCFAQHDKELRSFRRPNVERLMELVRKKRELEATVDKCQLELARSFDEASQQLRASIEGRIEDLSA